MDWLPFVSSNSIKFRGCNLRRDAPPLAIKCDTYILQSNENTVKGFENDLQIFKHYCIIVQRWIMKVAVITGASQGIGNAIAKKFSENGYRVFNLSRTPAEGIESIKTDVSDRENVFDSIGEVVKRAGRIDVLVNNAGFGISGAVEDTDESAVRKIFDVNYFGTLFATQAVIPVMRENGGGTIINMSSAGAPLSLPFQSFYSCTKSAVSSLSEALRIELKPFNIKVSTILPGDVKTEFTARREKNKSNSVYYGERIDKSVEKMERDEQNGMSPSVIAKIALKIAKSKNPPVYVVGGASYKLLVGLSKILPKRLVVWAIGKLYG